MSSFRPGLALTGFVSALALLPATSIAAEKFDGKWLTTQDCPAQGKMEELIRKIPSTIDGNTIRGEKGTAGEPGYEIVAGHIGDDGNAKLDVNGILANRANAHGLFAQRAKTTTTPSKLTSTATRDPANATPASASRAAPATSPSSANPAAQQPRPRQLRSRRIAAASDPYPRSILTAPRPGAPTIPLIRVPRER